MSVVFRSDEGYALTLDIVDYQFPDSTEFYDVNWLIMRIGVETNGERKEYLDPALMTWEYSELAAWLRIVKEDSAPKELITTDNVLLFFKLIVNTELVVEIRCDFAETRMYPARLNDFSAIADAIDAQLEKFPYRTSDER